MVEVEKIDTTPRSDLVEGVEKDLRGFPDSPEYTGRSRDWAMADETKAREEGIPICDTDKEIRE